MDCLPQNNFPSLTIKLSSGKCLTYSCNRTFLVSPFSLRLHFSLVDCKDRYQAIVEGTSLCSQSEFPSMSCKFQKEGFKNESNYKCREKDIKTLQSGAGHFTHRHSEANLEHNCT